MAIRVTKQGVRPSEIVLKSTCHTCKSEMEFTAADGQSCTDPRDNTTTVTIKCPVCGSNVHGYPKNS
jgi:hypothetical protein